ncbi:dihydrouridine synthase [Streptomyces sp. NPDC048527]|uniref:dihydrouridine synthase n=1 Tax=Streptomyces sp. NPDC048527 TaxID=3365568 RepID=UPI003718406E
MLLSIVVIAAGVVLRQVDRAHFVLGRPWAADARQLISLQRTRANDVTPLLLLLGQWVQIAGWWMLAAHGLLAACVAAAGVAVQFRHLQEVSHAAVHGVLARAKRANLLLAEVFAHHPLGLVPVPVRVRSHVRDHHPNAAEPGLDPNLIELAAAGLRPGVSRRAFAGAVLYPLTLRGLRCTVARLFELRLASGAWHRVAVLLALPVLAYLCGGWAAVICGVLLPRLVLYPQLAWLSTFVEHTWFDPDRRTGTLAEIEAGRCLRLYPANRLLAVLAAATWLPYGDLLHYAHSSHPSVRWNYLRPLERHLTPPHFLPTGLLSGDSVTRRHYTALAHAKDATPELADARSHRE